MVSMSNISTIELRLSGTNSLYITNYLLFFVHIIGARVQMN